MFEVPQEFRERVMAASSRDDVTTAVYELYARVQSEIDRRKPACDASGKCCHFDSYGHRLYVTTLELAAFVHDLKTVDRPTPEAVKRPGTSLQVAQSPGSCRFQVDKLCGVHGIRPFGCRIFFCDPTAGHWQQEQYEVFHAELRQLHAKLGVDYFYVEWREALAAIKL